MKELKIKSIAVFKPAEHVESTLLDMGFILSSTATVVSDGKFWKRMIFVRGEEVVSVSDEIGDVYPKDPVITIYGSKETIEKIADEVL